jgi:antirestriction protein ArdC
MSATVYDIVTERILGLLERGVVPWQKPWAQRDGAGNVVMPQNLVSGRAYRGVNVFLLGCSGYGAPYWVSFKQALDLGGNVRKGEKSTPAIFWKILDVEDAAAKDGRKKVPMLRYYSVFNVEQCDGLEYPKPSTETPEGAAPFDPIATAAGIVAGMPKPPTLTHREARAYYRPITDTVNMPAPELFHAPAAYYSTLFHELTHSTGHAARLARTGITELAAFGGGTYGREELVAEMGAAFLCAEAGVLHHTAEESAAYLANWIAAIKGDNKLVTIAAAQAQKAADYILGRLEEAQGGAA